MCEERGGSRAWLFCKDNKELLYPGMPAYSRTRLSRDRFISRPFREVENSHDELQG